MRIGLYHACALGASGTVQCWGANNVGMVGTATADMGRMASKDTLGPTLVDGITGAVQLALGHLHSCARLGDGTVRCWGEDVRDPSTGPQPKPFTVGGIAGAAELTSGEYFLCARSPGAVYGWGLNAYGVFGTPQTGQVAAPMAIAAFATAAEVGAFGSHLCGRADGSITCLGLNNRGQLGSGSSDPETPGCSSVVITDCPAHETSKPIQGLTASALGVGPGGLATCATATDGAVYCWGDNTYGQLGDPKAGPLSAKPVRVLGP